MDARSELEKKLWELIGPPLYYCEECLLAVSVTPVDGGEPVIKRKCSHNEAKIIAPRRAICVGKGGMNTGTRIKIAWNKAKASVTGRDC